MIQDFVRINALFTVSDCDHCLIYKKFFGRYNLLLPLDKRFHVIDCTKYHDFGIVDHELIRKFSPYIKGTYPALFIGVIVDGSGQILGGERVDSAISRVETESYIISRLSKMFPYPIHNPHGFNKECEFKKTPFGIKAICA